MRAAWPVPYQASSALEAALPANLKSQQGREAGSAPVQRQALLVVVVALLVAVVALLVAVAVSRIAARAERVPLAGWTLAQAAALAACAWAMAPMTAA